MATKVAVVPLRAGMNLRHPIDGLLKDEGSDWTDDQFTAVLLREGSIFRADDKSERPEPSRFNEGEPQLERAEKPSADPTQSDERQDSPIPPVEPTKLSLTGSI